MKPARTIVHRSTPRNVGAVHATYIQPEPIEWESTWEEAFIQIALPCPVIAHIQHQPFTLTYVDESGKERKHTPDFLVRLVGGQPLVVEVKPTKFVEQNKVKFDKSAALMLQRQAWYYVITEQHLNTRRQSLANLWRRYARVPASAEEVAVALQMVRENTAGCTVSQFTERGIAIETLYHLLGRRVLCAGRDLETTPNTFLNFPEKGVTDERLQFHDWFGCASWGTDISTRA
jgi:hypothetical protein